MKKDTLTFILRTKKDTGTHVFGRVAWLLGTALCATLLLPPGNSLFAQAADSRQGDAPAEAVASRFTPAHSGRADEKTTAGNGVRIPAGTILPVRLNSTISSAKNRPGKVITGRIMQDVPLAPGMKIAEGSKVVGHIVEVTPATAGAGARVSLRFDKLVVSHRTEAIVTSLRAIAGFMRVIDAQTPTTGPGRGDVYRWMTRVQVGGDVVYGDGGPVTPYDEPDLVIGKGVADGVLVRPRAQEGAECEGAIDGNDNPQALWVFSSDACGSYELDSVSIADAGRSEPAGVIVLAARNGELKVPGGAGMLLRVRKNDVPVSERGLAEHPDRHLGEKFGAVRIAELSPAAAYRAALTGLKTGY
jgi:hypothetical protein